MVDADIYIVLKSLITLVSLSGQPIKDNNLPIVCGNAWTSGFIPNVIDSSWDVKYCI